MPDREIEKKSPSGITIEGEPLERYVETEKAKELLDEVQSDVSEKVALYHKGRTRVPEQKHPNGRVKCLTRREINLQYGERLLMESTKLDDAIMRVLLLGDRSAGTHIWNMVKEVLPDTVKKDYDSRMSYFVRKTDLKHLITVIKVGNNNVYELVEAARGLSPGELLAFSAKSKKALAERAALLYQHEGLQIYFQPPDTPTAPPDTGIDTEVKAQDLPPSTALEGAISQAITKALGVKVEVSGRIEIVFKLGD